MFALTILYTVLFVYLYFQSRKFKTSHSGTGTGTGTERTTGVELPAWQATAESNTGAPCPDPQTFLRTQSVTMVSESFTRRARAKENDSRRRMSKAAVTMLYYPVVYICLTMPLTVARLAQFAGKNWSLTTIIVGANIYFCTGWVNVLLYTATRKGIISWNWLVPKRKRPVYMARRSSVKLLSRNSLRLRDMERDIDVTNEKEQDVESTEEFREGIHGEC
jgi:hypothetical protein